MARQRPNKNHRPARIRNGLTEGNETKFRCVKTNDSIEEREAKAMTNFHKQSLFHKNIQLHFPPVSVCGEVCGIQF